MLRLNSYLSILIIGTGLSACFQMPTQSVGKVTVLDESARSVVAKQLTEEKAAATMDPNAKTPQQLTAPSSGKLAGSSITMMPGSLSVSAELVVEEAGALGDTSLISELGLTDSVSVQNVSAGLIIRPTEGVNLAQPMTISMPLPITSGLRLQNTRNLAVFYKQYGSQGLVSGIIPSDKIKINSDGTCSFEGYFGAYWVASVAAPVTEAKVVKSEEPIVNAQKVSVIQSTGVVSEATIVAKAEIPPVAWATTDLVLDAATRTLRLTAKTVAAQALTACKADFMPTVTSTSGIIVEAGAQANASLKVVKAEAHSLIGRFRCLDEQGRQTASAWSTAVTIPALQIVLPPVTWQRVELSYSEDRVLKAAAFTSEARKLTACKARFQESIDDATDPHVIETGTALSWEEKPNFEEATSIVVRFECLDEEKRATISPWSPSINVPAPLPSTMVWGPTQLNLDTGNGALTLIGGVPADTKFRRCRVQLYANDTDATGRDFDIGEQALFTTNVTQVGLPTAVGRFLCWDLEGRPALSPWSNQVSLQTMGQPPMNQPPMNGGPLVWNGTSLVFDGSMRRLFVEGFMNSSVPFSNCRAEVKNDVSSPNNLFELQTGNALNTDFSPPSDLEHTLVARFVCNDGAGMPVPSPWSTQVVVPAEDDGGLVGNPMPTSPDYCNGAPSPMLYTSNGSSAPALYTGFSPNGACQYRASVFSSEAFQFAIAQADKSYSCGRSTHDLQADGSPQVLNCRQAYPQDYFNDHMNLPRGNYEILVTFTQGSDQASISAQLLPCTIGGLHMLTTNAYTTPTFPGPSGATQMTHHGACEFSGVATYSSYDYAHMRFQNNAGDLFCGGNQGFNANTTVVGTCGTNPGHFTSSMYTFSGTYDINVRYGLSFDPGGGDMTSFEMKNTKQVNCPENFHLLGPTTAGWNPMDSNRFMRKQAGSCEFEYNWLADAGDASTQLRFKVGNTTGTQSCGVGSNNYYPYNNYDSRSLDCSGSALEIDSPLIQSGRYYRFNLVVDETTGQPMSITIYDEMPVCNNRIYVQNNAAQGLIADPKRMMHEVEDCLYEYTMQPNTMQPFHFVDENNNKYCGASQSSSQPVLNGGPADAACVTESNQTLPPSIAPVGVTAGGTYKLRLDFRSNFAGGLPEVSIQTHNPAEDCDGDYYLTGPEAFGTLSPGYNKFERVSGCHFQLVHTMDQERYGAFHVYNNANMETCGVDNNTHYAMGSTDAPKTLDCSGTYPDFNIASMTSGGTYRFDLTIHNGVKKIHFVQLTPSCSYGYYPMLGGPAGDAISDTYLKTFSSSGGSCQNQLVWTPTTGATSFYLKGQASMVPHCGQMPGAPALQVNQGPQDIICHVRNEADALLITPNVTIGHTYALILDRSKPHLPPRLSIERLTQVITEPNSSNMMGPIYIDQTATYPAMSTPSYSQGPGNRQGMATWRDAAGKLWGFGGLSTDDFHKNDLWKFDPSDGSGSWTWVAGTDADDDWGLYDELTTDYPSARYDALTWYDAAGNKLWLFGGIGFDSTGMPGILSDLWAFDIASSTWQWVSGNEFAEDPGYYAHQGTPGTDVWPQARTSGSAWLAGGDLWLFGGLGFDGSAFVPLNDVWKFNISSGEWTWVRGSEFPGEAPTASDPGARSAMTSWDRGDGKLWMFSGDDANEITINDFWRYDTSNNTWTQISSHSGFGFWGNKGWMMSATRPSARYEAEGWVGAGDKLWLMGGLGMDNNDQVGTMGDIWVYSIADNQWAWVGGSASANNYGSYSTSNGTIGSRMSSSVWSDGNGGAYIFGGQGVGSTANYTGYLGDLWRVFP